MSSDQWCAEKIGVGVMICVELGRPSRVGRVVQHAVFCPTLSHPIDLNCKDGVYAMHSYDS